MGPFKQAVSIISSNWRSYIVTNILFYGVMICGMIFSAFHPEIQGKVQVWIQTSLIHSYPALVKAIQSGNIPLAIACIFVINSFLGAFASITVPSMILPFSGLLLTIYRACIWGLALSPTSHRLLIMMIPHSLTILLEGQAYVLTAFGANLWCKWFLFPAESGFERRGQGYIAGFKANVSLYKLILAILAISAIYEAIELIVLKHVLAN